MIIIITLALVLILTTLLLLKPKEKYTEISQADIDSLSAPDITQTLTDEEKTFIISALQSGKEPSNKIISDSIKLKMDTDPFVKARILKLRYKYVQVK